MMADPSQPAAGGPVAAGRLAELLEGFSLRDRRALARLASLLDRGQSVPRIEQFLATRPGRSLRIGLTGPGGAGKSTLTGALVKQLRRAGQSVAVLACDPASPRTGGALLGDRVRVDYEPDDAGVFFRSLSSRGAAGGISESMAGLTRLVEAFGFDVILLETVGAGQDQLAVRELVAVLVLVVTPASGDEVQWEKAGLLEVADLVVVNKGDLPGAEGVQAALRAMLDLSPHQVGRAIPVLRTTASLGVGVPELWEQITALATQPRIEQVSQERRLWGSLTRALGRQFRSFLEHGRTAYADPELTAWLKRFDAGQLTDEEVLQFMLPRLCKVAPGGFHDVVDSGKR